MVYTKDVYCRSHRENRIGTEFSGLTLPGVRTALNIVLRRGTSFKRVGRSHCRILSIKQSMQETLRNWLANYSGETACLLGILGSAPPLDWLRVHGHAYGCQKWK